MFWTEKKVAELIDLTKRGVRFREIGDILGCTKNAVIGKVHRLGIQTLQPVNKAAVVGRRSIAKPKPKPKKPSVERKGGLRVDVTAKYRPPSINIEMPTPEKHLGIKLLDLEPHHCRYPIGQGADITFCGQKRIPGWSFCAPCKGVVYRDE